MKKFTMFACLALALVFAMSSFAGEMPRMTSGNSTLHGGSVNFSKAGGDTINLMASSNDPTNSPGEPLFDGDFEDAGGNPSWNGWTHYDITQPTVNHWNVSDYNQPTVGNLAAWCGDIDIPSCDGGLVDPAGGYGNSWVDILQLRKAAAFPASSSQVTVTADLMYDSEPGYDFASVSYMYDGASFVDMQSWSGQGTVAVNNSITFLPAEYVDGTDIVVAFRFISDGAVSDDDCDYGGAGGCQVDNINVNVVNGASNVDYYHDFTDGTMGDWTLEFPVGTGDFAALWVGLEDNDPCNTNYSPQVAFIDDGVIVPGTGGSDCINWCYGPSGYIVNSTGGITFDPANFLYVAIESPVMPWPTAAPADPDGIILAFTAYRHEDLSSDSVGIFYTWSVRSADTDGSGGNGIQDITAQAWDDRNFVYYGGPDYGTNFGDDVTDLMQPGRDEVQIQMTCYELGWAWGWDGNDGYPAPYFDDVRVKIFPYNGPGTAFRELDMAQDNFPERGTIDTGDLASHSVRFDMANNVSDPTHLRNDPGDSMVVDITPVRTGADFDGDPALHYTVQFNPVFDLYRTAGMPAEGSVTALPALTATGSVVPGKWSFDLPDTGFLFPGDVLHYYISATDAIGGVGGSDPQTSLVPADTTGYQAGFGDPMGYNSTFVIHALPTIDADGFGGYVQPGMLFINDFANRGGENEWYTALNNIGLLKGEDYDVYYVNGPSSGVGNGIGGRATALTLTDYDDILYTAGDLSVNTIANGDFNNDAGNDVGALKDWIDQGSKDIFFSGDDLASDMAQAGTETLDMLENYFGCSVVTNDVRPLIGSQTAPLVKTVAGNDVFTLASWIGYGGCFGINTFDGVTPLGSGVRIAEFTDPAGAVGQYSYSAATLNIRNPGPTQSRIISMPTDLMFVYTDPAVALPISGRAQLLKEVLAYFGVDGDSGNVSDAPDRIAFQTSNYPNPFNPSTTIKYSMPKAGHLTLSIYNVRGQLVKTLIDGSRPMGADQTIVWDGTSNQGSSVSSGVYFYEARTGGEVKVQKMALVK